MRVALKQVECFWARGAGITWAGDFGGYEVRVCVPVKEPSFKPLRGSKCRS